MSEILKSPTGNQKKPSAFFASVPWLSFLLETFSTLLTLHCLKCLFHMNSHINKVVNVMFVGNVSRWNMTSENISKKSTWWFLVPGRRFLHFRHLLQNPNLKLMAGFSNNHYWAYTFLNPWALCTSGVKYGIENAHFKKENADFHIFIFTSGIKDGVENQHFLSWNGHFQHNLWPHW